MFSLACRDGGVTDCDYVAIGMTEEELWRDRTEHDSKRTWYESWGYNSAV